nr:hypothetical protein [Tanacetum cinerariifolium]
MVSQRANNRLSRSAPRVASDVSYDHLWQSCCVDSLLVNNVETRNVGLKNEAAGIADFLLEGRGGRLSQETEYALEEVVITVHVFISVGLILLPVILAPILGINGISDMMHNEQERNIALYCCRYNLKLYDRYYLKIRSLFHCHFLGRPVMVLNKDNIPRLRESQLCDTCSKGL